MTGNNSSNDNGVSYQTLEITIPRPVRFWLFLIFDIPSTVCSFFVIYHLLLNRTSRLKLNNHIIILILGSGLIIQLIDIPFHLSFISHSGIVYPSKPSVCLIWWFIDLGLYNGIPILMAWGSFERHILVFHDRWITTRKRRFLFHYLPLIILLLYIVIFYIVVILFPPCNNIYDYTLPTCNDSPCYLKDPILGIWDTVVNNILPLILITFFTVTLLVRVYQQKRRVHQPIRWRKQRKLTIQLVPICVLYLLVNVPLSLLIFAHLCGLPEGVGIEAQMYFDFLCYFIILLLPFLCLGSLPELRKKLRLGNLFQIQLQRRVAIVQPL